MKVGVGEGADGAMGACEVAGATVGAGTDAGVGVATVAGRVPGSGEDGAAVRGGVRDGSAVGDAVLDGTAALTAGCAPNAAAGEEVGCAVVLAGWSVDSTNIPAAIKPAMTATASHPARTFEDSPTGRS